MRGIDAAWPGILLIGCTTDGEFSSRGSFEEDSVTLTLFCSDVVRFSAGVGHNASEGLEAACQSAVQATGETDAKLCITTPESLTISGQQLVDYLGSALGGTPVLGGAAGDYWRFSSTNQFFGTDVLSDAIPILLFSGDLLFSFGVGFGWKPLGSPGVVTRANGSVVNEIDHQPAIEFYWRFLGKHAHPSGSIPLALLDNQNRISALRASVGVVDEDGAITFLGDVTEGTRVQIAFADRSAIIDGSRQSVESALVNYPEDLRPEAGLFFSCASRKLLLGSEVKAEEELIREALPEGAPFCGFYAYGEFSPDNTSRISPRFHNESFVSLLLGTPGASVSERPREPSDGALGKRETPGTPMEAVVGEEVGVVELRQQIRILETKLARSTTNRRMMEEIKDQTDILYQQVIQELEETNGVLLESIGYASRIQRAILPPNDLFDEAASEYFVLWEPRDRVGGDVYWCKPWGTGTLLALGDCTGHGVPGAFITLIANGALDMALHETMPGDTGALLQRVHQLVQEDLGQHMDDGESDDGLELGVCYVAPGEKRMVFTGARFSLFHTDGKAITEIKGDKSGVGYRGIPYDVSFSNRDIEISVTRTFYMTSDGLIDQIGGQKQRSFGKRRFKDLLENLELLPFNEHGARILRELESYQGHQRRRDDVSVMGFRLKG